MKTEYPGQWLTSPTESIEGDKTIFVTGRSDVDKFRNNPRMSIRIEVTMVYHADSKGYPRENESAILEEVTDRLVEVFAKDPVAVLTGIYTGDGERTWVFYTVSTHIFQRKFNEALVDLPTLPISIIAENDPEWLEYDEMRQML